MNTRSNHKSDIIEKNLQKLVELVSSGYNTPDALLPHFQFTPRQFHRYIRIAIERNLINRSTQGVYILSDSIDFNTFKIQFENMSQSIQHNITVTVTGTLLEPTDLDSVIQSVLKTSHIVCSEEDLHKVRRIMSYACWTKITTENVTGYVAETFKRFEQSAEKYDIRNAVTYFFGILKRVISSSVSEIKQAYLAFLKDQSQDEQDGESEEFIDEWKDIEDILEENSEHALTEIPHQTIHESIGILKHRRMNPIHIKNSVKHMINNDIRGFVYMLTHISNFDVVYRCIEKNYQRYLGSSNVAPSNNTRDERYNEFYKLFPNT